jgi:tetratricopeptide (TPR) repeat protein
LAEMPALEALEALLDGRLLAERPASRRPYTLAHDYIREVVYDESREARRRVYHRRALLALEAAGAPAAECAFHALAALLDEPAFRFSVTAGREAFASYALQEALAHFETALDVAQRMEARGEMVDAIVLGRLYRGRGQVLELIQDDQAAQENYETMRDVAVQRQDRAMELAALIAQSNLHGIYSGVFNPPKARELGSAALVLARELGDKPAEAGALAGLMQAELFGAGASDLVMTYGQQSLALARELDLKALIGRVLTNLCWPYFTRLQVEEALDVLEETKAILRSLGNLPQLTDAFNQEMILSNGVGDHRRILAVAPEMAELSASIGSRLNEGNALAGLASVHGRQGRFGQALACIEKAQTVFEAAGNPISMQGLAFMWMGIYLAAGTPDEAVPWADRLFPQRQAMIPNTIPIYFTHIAWTKIACGKLDEGQAILDELLADLPYDEVWSFAIIAIAVAYGHLHLAQGRPEALFAGLEDRVRPFREAGFIAFLADELWLRGRAELALGRFDLARAALLEARAAAEAQEERSILWQILATLSELGEACGDPAAAARCRDQARAVVDDVAEHAGPLRAAFVGQPAVAQLLGTT